MVLLFICAKALGIPEGFSMLDTSDTCFLNPCFITLVQNASPNLLNFLYIHCILLTNYHKSVIIKYVYSYKRFRNCAQEMTEYEAESKFCHTPLFAGV